LRARKIKFQNLTKAQRKQLRKERRHRLRLKRIQRRKERIARIIARRNRRRLHWQKN